MQETKPGFGRRLPEARKSRQRLGNPAERSYRPSSTGDQQPPPFGEIEREKGT